MKTIKVPSTIDVNLSNKYCQAVSTEKSKIENRSQLNIAQVGENRSHSSLPHTPENKQVIIPDNSDNVSGDLVPAHPVKSPASGSEVNDYQNFTSQNTGDRRQTNKFIDNQTQLDRDLSPQIEIEIPKSPVAKPQKRHTVTKRCFNSVQATIPPKKDDFEVLDDNKLVIDKHLTLNKFNSTLKFNYPLICPPIKENKYLVDRSKMIDSFSEGENITIPQVLDTEFTSEQEEDYHKQVSRTHISTQVKGIHKKAPCKGYAHHPAVNEGRLKEGLEPWSAASTMFDGADYLRDVGGVDLYIREAFPSEIQLKKLKRCTFVMYAHFVLAELNMVFRGSLKRKIKELQRSTGTDQIISGRRVYCQSVHNKIKFDTVSLQHIIVIDGIEYEMCLKIVDSGALHGISSYEGIAEAVGHKLLYKNLFTSEQKARMIDMAKERAIDFEKYALGDLDVYEILELNAERWREIYEILGLSDYYREPKLTIGGTVKDLFESSLAGYFQIESKKWVEELGKIIDEFIQPSSADNLRTWATHTRAILSKVEGGRCRNNRPIDMSIKGVFKLAETQLSRRRELIQKARLYSCPICDIDISSCYGEGQRNQDYPIGEAEIMDFEHCKNNRYIVLRKWLLDYGVKIDVLIKAVQEKDILAWNNPENWGELVPGLWMIRASTFKPLKYPQDIIASWFMDSSHGVDMLAKVIASMQCDTELLTTENNSFDEDTGSLKIFNLDIKNGVFTHDWLQWLFAVASSRQRNELLDNLKIQSSMVYTRSTKIDVTNGKEGLDKLREGKENWKSENTTERIKDEQGNVAIQRTTRKYHGWFSVNLGTLLVDKLLIERKKAKIQHGEKSPLDILFKLCVNTLYGDMVSKFFVTSNPVVGNNITARARVLAWYMEKGFYGFQPITDGCAFLLNGVLFSGRDAINGECVNLHRKDSKLSQWKIKKGSLGNVGNLNVQWVDLIIDGKSIDLKLVEMIDGKPFLNLDGEKVECCPRWLNKVREKDGELSNDLKKVQKAYLVNDDGNPIENSLEWVADMGMKHLQGLFLFADVLHKPSTALTVDKKTLEVKYTPRVGQFSFEVKDIFHSGSFHGSANYALENPNGFVVKARGYETKREHKGIEINTESDYFEFVTSDRYGNKNNPAKDLMKQILENPQSIKRQIPAIKNGILKIGEYKNTPEKYDTLGIEPGDNISKVVLMQEFSLSQFTFQSYEQYISWKKVIEKAKDKNKQSLEGFFLNEDYSLNLQALCEWVDNAISEGVMNPFDVLKDPHRNDRRTEKIVKSQSAKTKKIVLIDHPHLETVTALKAQLNNPPD